MVKDSACSLCRMEDSWRHSLLACNMSRCVWALVLERITEHMVQTSETDAKLRIFTIINTLNHDDLILCLVTLWAVWFARRKAIHEEVFQSLLCTYSSVESFLRDLAMSSARKERAKPCPVNHSGRRSDGLLHLRE
jgi:hypothetical protein